MKYSKNELLLQAVGVSQSHLVEFEHDARRVGIHCDMQPSFLSLFEILKRQGYQLSIVSSYRSFERQFGIFAAKAQGKRAVLDSAGLPIDISTLSDSELLFAILRWSALPGLSRHHFGSDIDVYDAVNQRLVDVELVPSEVQGSGPSASLHNALDSLIANNDSLGFYRPYSVDVGGIAPERWHLSFSPASSIYEAILSEEASLNYLLDMWAKHKLPLYDVLLKNIEIVLKRYVYVDTLNRPSWL